MPYQKSLSFTNVNEITFEPSATEIIIKVNGAELGRIHSSYPVTVYVQVNGNTKYLWMKEISEAVYKHNNNDDPQKTVTYNQENAKQDLHIEKCATTQDVFKIVGWDDEDATIVCTGGNGYNCWFAIPVENNFRAKMETVIINGKTLNRMIVRYSQNIKNACPSDAGCCANLFCYVCS